MPGQGKKLVRMSDHELRLLRLMAQEYENRPQNDSVPHRVQKPYLTPEVYVCLPVSSSGIPAITRAATGTGTTDRAQAGDIPGSGQCTVYLMVNGALTPSTGSTVTVYNFSEQVVAQDWFYALRDKFGTWFASNGSETVFVGIAQGYISTGFSGSIERLNSSLVPSGTIDSAVSPLGPVNHGAYVVYARCSAGFVVINTQCQVGTGTGT